MPQKDEFSPGLSRSHASDTSPTDAPNNLPDASRRLVMPPPNHDITLALLSAIMFPGIGQLYNGQTVKGAFLMFVSILVLLTLVLTLQMRLPVTVTIALLVGAFLLWLSAIIDASVIASRLIRREPVRRWQWF